MAAYQNEATKPQKSAAREKGISFRTIIERNPVLSQKETQELFYKKGTPEWPAARDKPILGNLRLVTFIAKKYAWIDGCSLDDVISNGIIGLMNAIDRFDPNVGTKLSTYAVYWIDALIKNELVYKNAQISTPTYVEQLAAKMDKLQKETEQETGETLSAEELSELMEIPENKTRFILKLNSRNMKSFDSPVFTDKFGTADPDFLISDSIESLDDVESEALRRVTLSDIMSAIRKLEPKEQSVIMMKFGFIGGEPMNMKQCSEVLGCSDETARRAFHSAIAKLQKDYLGKVLPKARMQ